MIKRKKNKIVYGIILLFVLFCIIKLNNVQLYNHQFIESETGMTFTSEIEEVKAFSLCEDDQSNMTQISDHQRLSVQLLNNDQKVIWSQAVQLSDLAVNQFGAMIDLSHNSLKMVKGDKYSIRVLSDSELQNTVSVCLYGDQVSIINLYLVFCSCILCLLFLIIYLYKKKSFIMFFCGAAVVVGLMYNFIMPTLCVPDEYTHFSEAYTFSNEILHLNQEKDTDYHVLLDESGIQRLSGKIGVQEMINFWSDWTYGNQQCKFVSDRYMKSDNLAVHPYIPSAIALTLTRALHMPYQIVLLSGRIANMLFFVAVCVLAMKFYEPMRYAIAAIALLPSTLWLVSSYSYDAWNLAFCILFVTLCMKLREKESGIQIKDILLLLIVMLLFVSIKYIYVVLALLILLIPFSQWKDKRIFIGCIISAVVVFILLAISRGSEVIAYVTTSRMDTRGLENGDKADSYTIGWVLHHPIDTLLVYFKTSVSYFDHLLTKSVISEFYNAYVPTFLVALVICVFGILMITGWQTTKIEWRFRIKAILIFLLGCIAVYAAFLFAFTNIDDSSIGVIDGMQGRYFLPFYILLPLFLHSDSIQSKLNLQKEKMGITKVAVQQIFLMVLVIMNFLIIFCKFVGVLQN